MTEIDPEVGETSGKNKFKEKDEKPSFSARPNTKNLEFDFKKELKRLPFELNIGDSPITSEQEARLIDVIYDHTEVFSLFNGDLGFCDVLKHSIPTTTDKPVSTVVRPVLNVVDVHMHFGKFMQDNGHKCIQMDSIPGMKCCPKPSSNLLS